MSTSTLANIQPSAGALQFQVGQQTEFFRVTESGLFIVAGTPHEEWRENIMRPALEDFEKTRNNHAAAMFRLGDALAFGEREYGEMYAQEIDATRKFILLNVKTIENAMRIAKNVRAENRHEMLTFSHHDVVQGLEPAEQKELLDKAEDEAWTVSQLRKEVKSRHPGPVAEPATGKKAIIDLESEDGLLHAAEKVLEFFKAEEVTPDQWSKERIRQWAPVIGPLVTYFAKLEPVACDASNAVAAFLDDPDNGPLKNWSDKRKAKWSPSLNAIAKAGRRGEMTACGVSKKKNEDPQEPPTE